MHLQTIFTMDDALGKRLVHLDLFDDTVHLN
jgi:hypothetical protein